jgi:serine/threonine protein kinase/Tol biopolymer transport system component
MTPERWQQIDGIFHSVLEHPPGARTAFLRQACGADEFLRSEVESLIQFHEESDDFIDKPAGDLAAELLNDARTRLEAGHLIGHYRIAALLGAGGMGEVYRAEDLKLGRQVALKLLPAEFTTQVERVRRFEMEARAASALNHPNILTIYEVGQADSLNFIATEYVDGQTLRQHMRESELGTSHDPSVSELPIDIGHVLELATQIASALAAAHSAGIVHRDIKPENIMLRRDGIVKVLDFGLAKLSAAQTSNTRDDVSTSLRFNTYPGVVMGTVRYMSPEQARGLEVDSRTDIWSLGVVLYEMLAGVAPFEGETPSHVIVSILEDELPPLSNYAEMPAELKRIVIKALNKNRDHRHQKASDLARDLQSLRQGLEADARLPRTLKRGTRTDATAKATQRRTLAAPGESLAPTLRVQLAQSTSSAEHFAHLVRDHKKVGLLALTLFLVAVGVTFGVYRLVARRNHSSAVSARPFQTIELVRLTATGRVRDAAISLDGKHLAYVAENGGRESIWLRDVTTSHNVEIVPPADLEHYGATFSPDGADVYYITKARNNTIGALNRVAVLGGVPVKLIVDVDGPVSFSPDGKELAFVRGSSTGERALVLANADGSGERKLATRTGYHAFSFHGPAWSPDGKSIVCGAAIPEPNGRLWSLVAVDVGDGSIKPLTNQKWRSFGRISWLKEGNGMVFAATGLERSSTSQLWYLSYPSAEVQRITRDLQDYHGVSITSDSKTLISKQGQTTSSLWIAPNSNADRASKILSHKEDDAYLFYYRTRFSWTPSGQIIYSAIVNGTPSIWMMSPEGTGNIQLSSNPSDNGFPSMTNDGRHIIFVSDGAGFLNVWRMDSDGGNETQLTTGEDESWAWISPDSRWIVYHSGKLGRRTLWRVPRDGGKQEQLTDYPSICPVVSPDGNWISCYYRPETKAPWKLAIIPFDGGPPVKTFEVPQNVVFQSLVRWTPDGLSLAYIKNQDGISNIWTQPVNGGPAKQLTNFKSDQIFWFDWSPDGQQLGVSRGAVSSDVVLIKDLGGLTN